jgi:hypothetical protein
MTRDWFPAMARWVFCPAQFRALDLLSEALVCTENLIWVDDVMESPKLAE